MAGEFHFSWIDDGAKAAGSIFWRGTAKDDTFHGKSGDDQLFGLGGDDKLYGNKGTDYLHGQNGRDKLFGEAGNDSLDGGNGDDELTGGGGIDSFNFSPKSGNDVIVDFELGSQFNCDTVVLNGHPNVDTFETLRAFMKQDATDTVIDFGNGDVLTLRDVLAENLAAYNFSIG